MPEIEKELEEYKDRTDDFSTGLDLLFPRHNLLQSGDRQRKGSNVSNEELASSQKDHHSNDKAPHKSLSMIVGSKISANFKLGKIN